MDKRAENEKDVYDITLNYSTSHVEATLRMQLNKISVPFAKEQSSIECKMIPNSYIL